MKQKNQNRSACEEINLYVIAILKRPFDWLCPWLYFHTASIQRSFYMGLFQRQQTTVLICTDFWKVNKSISTGFLCPTIHSNLIYLVVVLQISHWLLDHFCQKQISIKINIFVNCTGTMLWRQHTCFIRYFHKTGGIKHRSIRPVHENGLGKLE